MKKKSCIFLATPDFTLPLLKLFHQHPGLDIKQVWTNPDKNSGRGQKLAKSKLVIYCEENKIPLYQPVNLDDKEALKVVKKVKADFAFIIAYGHLIKKPIIESFTHGMFNLHFSLLPQYRGASPIQSALLAGKNNTGLTIQRIDEGLDSGDITHQNKISIKNKLVEEVFADSVVVSETLCLRFIEDLLQNQLSFTPQNHQEASYCGKFSKKDGWTKANDDIWTLYNRYRAFHFWPGTYITIASEKYELREITSPENLNPDKFKDGSLVRNNKRLFLYLSGGRVEILQIKKQGKKELAVMDFLNGFKRDFPLLIDSNIH